MLEVYTSIPSDEQLAMRNQNLEPDDFADEAKESVRFWHEYYLNSLNSNEVEGGNDETFAFAATLFSIVAGSQKYFYTQKNNGFDSIGEREQIRRLFFANLGVSLLLRDLVKKGAKFVDGDGPLITGCDIDISVDAFGIPLEPAVRAVPSLCSLALPEHGPSEIWFRGGNCLLVEHRVPPVVVFDGQKSYASRRKNAIPSIFETMWPHVARI